MTLSRLQLFRLLRRNVALAERRDPMSETNRYARLWELIAMAALAVYFIFMGTSLGALTDGGDFGFIFGFFPLMMAFDMLMRFGLRRVPLLLMRPYTLQPLRRRDVVDCFLCSLTVVDTMTLVWTALLLPYTFICYCGGLSLGASVALFLMGLLWFAVNGQLQLLVSTLAKRNLLWWLLPVVLYLLLYIPLLFNNLDKGVDVVLRFCVQYAVSLPAFLLEVVLFAVLFAINRRVFLAFAADDVAMETKDRTTGRWQFSQLSNRGIVGQFLALEIKSALRNKPIGRLYLSGLVLIVLITLITTYSDVYDGTFTSNFWCIYGFIYFSAVNLSQIMGPEGNYIDLLLVYRENIYQLLRAKYFFFTMVLLLPTVLMLPAVVAGKYPVLMFLAYLLTASGPVHFVLFQLAVYNCQTRPLSGTVTGKNNANTLQMIILLAIFIVPEFFMMGLAALFSETTAAVVMIVIGAAFTATHNLWLRNIYRRMMARKYILLEGFRASR